MASKPSQPKKKPTPLTLNHLEKFAKAIQKDFRNLDAKISNLGDTVTTLDGKVTKMGRDLATVKEDVKNIKEIMVSKADLRDAIHEEFNRSQQAEDIENLRGRVVHIEQKLGMNQRAA